MKSRLKTMNVIEIIVPFVRLTGTIFVSFACHLIRSSNFRLLLLVLT